MEYINPNNTIPFGTILNGKSDYKVLEKVGQGGMGIVYKVENIRQKKYFAAKILSSHRFKTTDKIRRLFEREVEIQNRINHLNVLALHEVLEYNTDTVAIMDFVQYGSLYDRLRELRNQNKLIPILTAIDWIWQILKGTSALHNNSIVHRDITPKNILFSGKYTLVISDFGIARHMDDITVTSPTDRLGSLIYISAEQRDSPHDSQLSDDVFSVGQIIYEILTGIRPHGNPEAINIIRPGLPSLFIDEINKMRSHARANRHTNIVEACISIMKALFHSDLELPISLLIDGFCHDEFRILSTIKFGKMGLLYSDNFYSPMNLEKDEKGHFDTDGMIFPIQSITSDGSLKYGTHLDLIIQKAKDEYYKLKFEQRMEIFNYHISRVPKEKNEIIKYLIGEYCEIALIRKHENSWEVWIGKTKNLNKAGSNTLFSIGNSSDLRGPVQFIDWSSDNKEHSSLLVDFSLSKLIIFYWRNEFILKKCENWEAPFTSQSEIDERLKLTMNKLLTLFTNSQSVEKWIIPDQLSLSELLPDLWSSYKELDYWNNIESVFGG